MYTTLILKLVFSTATTHLNEINVQDYIVIDSNIFTGNFPTILNYSRSDVSPDIHY